MKAIWLKRASDWKEKKRCSATAVIYLGGMILGADRGKVLAKLINACNEIDDALNLSAPAARYDPVEIPQALRNELKLLLDNLKRIVQHIEGLQ